MKHIGFVESNLTGSGFQALQISKEMGLRVTFLTRSLEEYLRFPGNDEIFKSCVDEIIYYDDNNIESVIKAIQKQGTISFDGIMSVSDYHVPIAAGVAKHFGLPGLRPQAANNARNKCFTRAKCLEYGVPAPKFASVNTLEEVLNSAIEIGFPCVIKPVDESASHGVVMCENQVELEAAYHTIQANNINSRGQERVKSVLIEEFLRGYEVSVELVVKDKQYFTLGITDKKLVGMPYFIEIGHLFPSQMPDNLFKECEKIAIQALNAIQFDFGPAHVELKITENGPKLVEVNARTAGGHITDLVDLSLGIPYLKEMIRMFLGEEPDLDATKQKGASIQFFTASSGIVTEIHGIELVKQLKGVQELNITCKKGDYIRELQSNRERLGYVITTGDSPYEAKRLAESVLQHVKIITKQKMEQ
ncbi:ATP-grasp domain-containing protein [Paenibacillus kribbensis]|uniref:ATP-grasp domain-containing protein n=1 Tax=Paenibacillus kribbensis TaxID=172713 RepID=UPI0015C19645|nr:ATP-grasp domain-containing protein [Paenibacillus kribbensis]